MNESTVSIGLLDDFNDLVRNHDMKVEPAEGLIFREMSKYQRVLLDELDVLVVDYELDLWPGQRKYDIPPFIGKIIRMEFSRDILNPEIIMPENTPDTTRYIEIIESSCKSETLIAGDILYIKAVFHAGLSDDITRYNSPIVSELYYDVLVDAALARYGLKKKDEVRKEALRIRNSTLNINQANAYRPAGLGMGW